ncbi:hypothetical protein [Bradyrhizobium sp.]|uniref:hypothetical protein n=1 Tax=Bradyrhizobium sp. TaxID=376 RepID=UPI0025C3B0B5|nr:hypothetical protein [Bradyrhizobium sp.]
MPRSQSRSQRGDGIRPKAPVLSAIQIAILLATALAVIFAVSRMLDAFRAQLKTTTDAAVSSPVGCPQLAETFDSQRAACLRRRWSALREMKLWPGAPQNAQLEDCLRSAGGEVAVPFRTDSCGPLKTLPRLQRAQN